MYCGKILLFIKYYNNYYTSDTEVESKLMKINEWVLYKRRKLAFKRNNL